MRIEGTFLNSRVARRIFFLFVLCAVVPVASLGALSVWGAWGDLAEQNQRRLHQVTKDVAVSVTLKLRFLASQLSLLASQGTGTNDVAAIQKSVLDSDFSSLTLVGEGTETPILGRPVSGPTLTGPQTLLLASGKPILLVDATARPPRVFLTAQIEKDSYQRLVGEIDVSKLWGWEALNDDGATELIVFDDEKQLLFTSLRTLNEDDLGGFINAPEVLHSGVSIGDREYQTHTFKASHGYTLSAANWNFSALLVKAGWLPQFAVLRRPLLLVLVGTILLVAFLSVAQIRRSLDPIEKLQDATKKFSLQDFGSSVSIDTGDEFQDLAESFNGMAGQLRKQFWTLKTIGDIDRKVLSSLSVEDLVETVLGKVPRAFPGTRATLTLLDSDSSESGTTYVQATSDEVSAFPVTLTPLDLDDLCRNPARLVKKAGEEQPGYLAPSESSDSDALVLPIFARGRLSAILSVSSSVEAPSVEDHESSLLRKVADQVGVALANAQLVQELDHLSWGTLQAFSRSVDAKSPWTAGHSERVTEMALAVAQQLGLGTRDLEIIKRGSLLHDIGKIGVPARILDKPTSLTEAEYEIVKEHTTTGARILEPIRPFAPVIPIVRSHHERFDGKGYPDGLAGESIPYYARIVSVADCYDSLASDRPYRSALGRRKVVEMIRQNSGTQFDPVVTRAFLEVIRSWGPNLVGNQISQDPDELAPTNAA